MKGPKPPRGLVDAIKERRAVLVLGSGMSQAAGGPSWKELLLGLAAEASESVPARMDDIVEAVQNVVGHKHLAAASALREILGASFRDAVVRQIHETREVDLDRRISRDRGRQSSKKAKERQSPFKRLGAPMKRFMYPTVSHRMLSALPFKLFITTNFDRLLESGSGLNAVSWSYQNLGERVQDGTPFVLKLHGDEFHRNDIVLSREDYQRIANNEYLQEVLHSVFLTSVPMWVGYGHEDPDLDSVLDRMSKTLGTGGGYTLSTGPKLFLSQRFEAARITPAWIEQHEGVEAFVRQLVEGVGLPVVFGVNVSGDFASEDDGRGIGKAVADVLKEVGGNVSVVGFDRGKDLVQLETAGEVLAEITASVAEKGSPFARSLSELGVVEVDGTRIASGRRASVGPSARGGKRATEGEEDGPVEERADQPLEVGIWVGRKIELSAVASPEASVVAICGMGGQGKSSLASVYWRNARKAGTFEFMGWRDCKEEAYTFRTHVIRLIERVSRERLRGGQVADASIEALVRLLFQAAETRSCLFVFDNVDEYVDVSSGGGTQGLDELIRTGMEPGHHVKVIVTCRPPLGKNAGRFVRLDLGGLAPAEARELIEGHGIVGDLAPGEEGFGRIMEVTQGHPYWLVLLARKSVNERRPLEAVVEDVVGEKADDLRDRVLESIWGKLDRDARVVLRVMAETVKPEKSERIGEYAVRWLKKQEARAAFERLRSLQLVLGKRDDEGSEAFELHALVRRFVHQTFLPEDRQSIILEIVPYYEQLVIQLRTRLKEKPSLSTLRAWTRKVELESNARRYGRALGSLEEVKDALLGSGWVEEFLRVSRPMFEEMNWGAAMEEAGLDFNTIFGSMVEAYSYLGKYTEAERMLTKFEALAEGRSALRIQICNLRCHLLWLRKEYKEAIGWGEEGVRIKEEAGAGLDTRFGARHSLALALRDGGEVERAMEHFLGGMPLEMAVNDDEILRKKPGDFFGNVGRCQWLLGEGEMALKLYRRSRIALNLREYEMTFLNLGFADFWTAEVLEARDELNAAYVFYHGAWLRWRIAAPPKAEEVAKAMNRVVARGAKIGDVDGLDSEHNDLRCHRWLEQNV